MNRINFQDLIASQKVWLGKDFSRIFSELCLSKKVAKFCAILARRCNNPPPFLNFFVFQTLTTQQQIPQNEPMRCNLLLPVRSLAKIENSNSISFSISPPFIAFQLRLWAPLFPIRTSIRSAPKSRQKLF